MQRNVFHFVAIFFMASPALADVAWESSIQRGLMVFDLSSEGNEVVLTCDPDHVFGDTSNGSLRVLIDGADSSSLLVAVDQKGNQARFSVERDLIMEANADPEEWSEMLRIISEGGDFAFVTSTGSAQFFDVVPIPDLSCE